MAAQTGFGLTDLIEGKSFITTGFEASAPITNVSNDLPGVQAVAIEDNYEIDATNDTLPFNEGAGQFNVVLTHGRYNDTNLGAHIGALMTAHPSTALTYTAARLGDGRWSISVSSGTFTIEWDDDAVSAALANELGYDAVTGGAVANNVGQEVRWSTSTLVVVDFGAAQTWEMLLLYLDSTSTAAEYSSVAGYLHTSYLGDYRAPWAASASETLTISTRSTESDNPIQFALRATGEAGYRYLCLSWRHFDTADNHAIGLLKAFSVTYDSANGRTIGSLLATPPLEDGPGRSPGNLYPVEGTQTWGAELRFEDWEAASWRTVGHALARHGKKRPVMWVLDYLGNTATGADDLGDLADYGYVLWATVRSISNDQYGGQADAYVTNKVRLQQVPV